MRLAIAVLVLLAGCSATPEWSAFLDADGPVEWDAWCRDAGYQSKIIVPAKGHAYVHVLRDGRWLTDDPLLGIYRSKPTARIMTHAGIYGHPLSLSTRRRLAKERSE